MPHSPTRRRSIDSLWRLRGYVRPYAGHMVLMAVVACAAVGASIVIPLVAKGIVDGPIRHGDRAGLVPLGLLALALGVTEAALVFIRRWVQASSSLAMEQQVRDDLYAHLQRLPVAFHDGWQSGQLLSRATSDLSTIRRFVSFGLIFLFVNTATFVVVVVLLVGLSWPLGLFVAAMAVPLLVISSRLERAYLSISRQVQDTQGDLATYVEESALGVRVIRAFGRRDHVGARFRTGAQTLHDITLRKAQVVARYWPAFDLVPNITLAGVLVAGAVAVARGSLTLGGLVAFVSLMLMLVWPVDALGYILANAQEAMTAADRVYEIFDSPATISDRPGAVQLREVRGHVRLDAVGFTYPGQDRPVLHDVTLEIQPGETLALVGATGSGKSTLTSLLPRLHDVTTGSVRIDGHDVRDVTLDSLRRVVATAFEEATLFSASVRDNLTLGHPDASEAEITEALEVAQAGFVYDLPWGLATRIGEQGLSLSGGQRQRLALARAVLGRPRVLVLDDPLSALDVHTEALVERALAAVLERSTALLVVHRPSTVALADRVALLEGGTITAVGTHHDLLATVPAYRAVLSQTAEEVSA